MAYENTSVTFNILDDLMTNNQMNNEGDFIEFLILGFFFKKSITNLCESP